jgi:hypothetical protein
MTYAPSSLWDSYYQSLRQAERDLNPTGSWAASWIPLLDHYSCTRLLDLGCGTGGDCLVLARHGLDVIRDQIPCDNGGPRSSTAFGAWRVRSLFTPDVIWGAKAFLPLGHKRRGLPRRPRKEATEATHAAPGATPLP